MPEDVALLFDNVTVRFQDTVALDRVSFHVGRGDTWVVMGAAGSGKSVLCKVAIGLIRPDSGRVEVFGENIAAMEERELFAVRAKLGMLFQESALFDSLNIEDNVGYPLENQTGADYPPAEIRERVAAALNFVELGDTLAKFPSELSGGMRRRVGIARATVTDPPLAIYDSPTAGLDPITANNIISFIAKQRDLKRTTTLIVSNRYQDGLLMANYTFASGDGAAEGRLVPNRDAGASKTHFAVMREGRLAFSGLLDEFASSTDPYVSKFGKR
jgi:phospholipid/cholesterol/gamma-HCH transport system ATP-binding protein